MAKNQKSYTPEFKQQIVDLYNAGGTSYPQLEREYGVNRSTISGWVKQLSLSCQVPADKFFNFFYRKYWILAPFCFKNDTGC